MAARRKKQRTDPRPATPADAGGDRLRSLLAPRLDLIGAAAVALAFVAHLFATADPFLGSGTDMVSMEHPLHAFAAKWLGSGVLPLWNPYLLGGAPFQTGMHGYLYPGWWSAALFPVDLDLKLGIALHLILAAVGATWFARGRVESRAAALLAGLVFALSGFFVAHLFAGHRTLVATAAWLPWIAGALDRAARRGPRWLLPGAAIAGLAFLSGHHQLLYIGGGALLAWLLLDRGLDRDAGPLARRLGHAGGAWLTILAAGAAVAAVQLLPTWEAVTLSQRAGEGVEFAASFSSAPANLLTYLVPHLFGNQAEAPFVGSWAYWESLGYLGLAPLVLAAFALAALPWRHTLPLLIVIASALVLSLGTHTPLFEPYVALVPGADLFRSPGRFCVVATLFGALLAAQGLDAWLKDLERRRRLVATAAAAGLALAVSITTLALRPSSFEDHVDLVTAVDPASKVGDAAAAKAAAALLPLARSSAGTSAALAILAGGLLLPGLARSDRWRRRGALAFAALLAVDLYLFGHGFLTTAPGERFRWPDEVRDLLRDQPPGTRIVTTPELRAPNRGAALGVGDVGGYDILMDGSYARYLNRAAGRDPDQFVAFARIKRWGPALDRLGASLLLSGVPMSDGRSPYAQGFGAFEPWKRAGGIHVHRHPDPAPRAVVVHRVEVATDEAAAFARLADPGFDTRRTALVEAEVGGLGGPSPGDSAVISVYEPNRVAIRVTAGEPGLLVLSDNPWPGWSAAVDGAPAEILRANLVMRALRVPAGAHLVEFRFLPATFVIGGVISLLSVLALIAGFVWLRRRSATVPRG
jgi:hypothetical protein